MTIVHTLHNIDPAEYDILVVDDNPENLKILGNFLNEQGFNVRVARDGAQALESAEEDPPDLVLLDIHMPVMDGYETCRRIKESPDLSGIPVIFLSALGETFNKVRAFQLGGADYVSKPFELEEVGMRIGVHLLANQMLAENRAGFRASFEQAAVGMAHIRLNGTIIDINVRFSSMLGSTTEQLQGTNAPDVIPGALGDCIRNGLTRLRDGEKEDGPHEVPLGTSSVGITPWVKVMASVVRVGSNRPPYAAVIVQDITERRIAEGERRQMLVALERAPDAIALTDAKGHIVYANRAYHESLEGLDDEAQGETHRLFAPQAADGGGHAIRECVAQEGVWHGRTTTHRKGGSDLVEEHSVSAMDDGGSGEGNYVIVSRDISSQLKLEYQLRQSQKMEAIGTLAAGIAHDFNNLLAAISGFTELALQDLPSESEASGNLREVSGAAERARELVRQILAFGRQSEFQIRPVQLPDAIREIVRLLRRTIPPTIEISCDIDDSCPPILADATAVHQILMNLCTNAYHAMEEDGGTMAIRLTYAPIDLDQLQGHPDLKPGLYARIEVSDTGHGIDEATRQRIFEPYFTTKEQTGGTGLGLATVHGIVCDMSGAIHVYSEVGMGSTFSVILPVASELLSDSTAPTMAVATGKNEHILIVDDETVILRFAEKALPRIGYRATTVSDPIRAVELIRASPKEFDVVVTDEMMPAMRGSELLRQVREIEPSIPVILYSGFSGSRSSSQTSGLAFDDYVMKPMVISELSRAIRNVLDTD